MKANAFTREERIRKNSDIKLLQETGKKIFGKYYIVIYENTNRDYTRLAVLVSKRNRGIVKRNYEKRVIREIFRTHKDLFKNKMDLIIIKRKDDKGTYKEKIQDFLKIFDRIQC